MISNPIHKEFKRAVTILFSAAVALLPACRSGADTRYAVMKGPFRQTVLETGELQAVNSSHLGMPRINYIYGSSFKVVGLAEHGKSVQKGEIVIRFDPASVQKYIIERNESLENELASANKLKAQMLNSMQDLKAQLRNEQASWDIKKLQVDRSGFESEGIRRVIELEFRQADIRLNKIKRNLERKPRLDSLDMLIQQIKISQKKNELAAASEALDKMVIRSPLNGIFVVEENWRTGQTIKLGDEVYMGAPLARIPDIQTMKVRGIIQENDISRISEGQSVIVRLDALPAVPFHGKLSSISRVCIRLDDRKIFRTEVVISESDLRLKPGMTVSCEYITYENDNALFVPNECILEEGGHYYLFIKRGNRIRKTEIGRGPSNNLYTVVSGDIREGQALVPPGNTETRKPE